VPTVAENASIWEDYDWPAAGEEWSGKWGGSEAQWLRTILPRIGRFLPTGTILEVGPGFGRWTHYLRNECERLIVVDLSERCIRACRERFAGDDRIACHVNDGSSLSMIESESIDFVFSFDSLVHAEADAMERYVQEFARVLSAGGAGFVHHSNAGSYRRYFEAPLRLPNRVRDALWTHRVVDTAQLRGLSMTAARFADDCEAAGLRCIGQELVNWDTKRLLDCLSTFASASSPWARPNRVVRNPDFMAEAAAVKRWAQLYL
jgi:SAM-dependent methyltransferase